jgi:HAD superfamily hydrolase (TIGR01549 family)
VETTRLGDLDLVTMDAFGTLVLRERRLDRYFSAVVTAAGMGAEKPDPAVFHAVLARLRVRPERALHIGDPPKDVEGARTAGMRFAWAPVPDALVGWR